MDALERTLHDLTTVMELQVAGMEAFEAAQLAAREALKSKDWPALDKGLRNLDYQAEGLRCLEDRRHGLWTDLQTRLLGREGRFFETVRLVPEPYRADLQRLHRDLKVRASALQGLSRGLAAYVQTAGALVRAVVQELQPDLKGRIYSRNGSLRGGEVRSLVLNTHS